MQKKKGRGKLAFLLGALGPGVLAALADNDAGGVISYTVTGAKFGTAVFVPLTLCLVFITYTVQEMAMRLGAVTAEGYTHLVRKRYGRGWMVFQVLSLLAENCITLLTEFIGMSAGLVVLGIPLCPAVLLSAALVLAIALFSGYKAKERIGIIIGLLNFVFLVIACFTKPGISNLESLSLVWDKGFLWYVAALVGNAIAPWMIFYQSSAYVDKGVRAQHIKSGRADTIVGCVCQVAVAASLIFIGASLSGNLPNVEQAGPAQIISALGAQLGPAGAIAFALGLFDAGLLAAITVSLSSSWSVAEAFGWAKSLNDKFRDAPGFYGIYCGSVCLAAAAALLPGLPLNHISVLAQVLGGILMTPVLVFLTLLTSNREIMGEHANAAGQRCRAWFCVAVLGLVSVFTVLSVIL